MTDGEYHVASFVVSVQPRHASEAARCINSMAGLEVHAEERGKLVVTAEAGNVRELAELAMSLESMEYAIAVAPVYHEYAGAGDTETPASRNND